MGDNLNEKTPDQEEILISKGNQTEDVDSNFNILLTMMKKIEIDNERNQYLLLKTSVELISLKESTRAFHIEIRASLAHITKTLDSLNESLGVTTESEDPIEKKPEQKWISRSDKRFRCYGCRHKEIVNE